SPIRRYPDLEIHRLLKKVMHGQMNEAQAREYHNKMPDMALRCSKRERIADEAERDTDQLKKVEYMSDKIGQTFQGIISGVTNWGVYVELPNTVEGMVSLAMLDDDYYEFDERRMSVLGRKTGKSYRLGDKVMVIVAKVSKEMGTIDFLFEDTAE
ncbi:MAG: S1 RNA-binding domain-containing protein, partial [Anaerotignum sp.]